MVKVAFKGSPISLYGDMPKLGQYAPLFLLTKTDLSEVDLPHFQGKRVVMNIFPSLDTPTCANSVRAFNREASKLKNTVVLCISKDLPFAQSRFCGAEGLDQVIPLSAFRDEDFGQMYGIEIADEPLHGLLARAVIILDDEGTVIYTQLVKEITDEPDYAAALKVLA